MQQLNPYGSNDYCESDRQKHSIGNIMNDRHTLSAVGLLFVGVLSAQSPCLIASYPFDGNASDVTGNGHDGTVFGATLATDRFGNVGGAYQFDGLDDYIKLALGFSSNEGTVSAWINMASITESNPVFVGRDTTFNGIGVELTVDPNTGADASRVSYGLDQRDCVGGGCNLFFEIGETQLDPTTWKQIAMSSDGSQITVFIDGIAVSAYQGSCGSGGGLWFDDLCQNVEYCIGRHSRPLSSAFFHGRIDDVKVFNCALSPAQMDSLYQAEAPPPTCLIANYTFNGDAIDITGNEHDGTVHGTTLATDRFGIDSSCYQFNGTTDYIDISGTWTGSNGTISAYLYLDDLDDYRPIFQHDDNDLLGNSFAMNIDCATCQDSSRIWFGFDHRECGGDLHVTVAQPKLEPGVWTHVAMSADETTTHLYFNCVEVPTYLYGNNPGLWFDDLCAGPFTTLIGKSVASDGSEFNFKGRIDDLRVYNCALSAEEIATLCDLNTATAELGPSAQISVYPNPTTGLLRLTNLPKNAVPHVFDATGRRISVDVQEQGSEQVIDLSASPIGLYIIRVADQSFSIVRQ